MACTSSLLQARTRCVVEVNEFRSKVALLPKGLYLETPVFMTFCERFQFSVEIYPNGNKHARDGYTSVCILARQCDATVKCAIGISVVGLEGLTTNTPCHGRLSFGEIRPPSAKVRFNNLCRLSDIEAHGLSPCGRLLMKVDLRCIDELSLARIGEEKPWRLCDEPVDELGTALQAERLSREGDPTTDIVLQVGEQTFPAHRCVLRARSPVFRQMFAAGMAESASAQVVVKELDSDTVQRLLEFMYTSRIPPDINGNTNALLLLAMAGDRYQVPALVEACVEQVHKTLTAKVAIAVLLNAERMGLNSLKRICIGYISRDPETTRKVQDSPDFDRLQEEAPALLHELFIAISGSGKRRRTDGLEFAAGSDWSSMTLAQLQRACDERDLAVSGSRQAMVCELESHAAGSDIEPKNA